MMGRRIVCALLWVLSAIFLLIAWLSRGNALLLGAFFAVLLLPMGSVLINLLLRDKIKCTAAVSPTSPKRVKTHAVVTLKSDAPVCLRVSLSLKMQNALTKEETATEIFCAVPPRGKVERCIDISSTRCGQITVSAEHMWLFDICGIFAVSARCECGSARVTILPDLFMPEIGLSLLSASQDDSETYSNERKGNDLTELWELHEYVPGDDLRRIHWKLSAKNDRLIVREGSFPLQRSLLVFWDKTATGEITPAVADALAESVSSVCRALSEDGFAYTIGWSGEGAPILEQADDTDRMLALLPRMVRTIGEGECGTAALTAEDSDGFYGRVLLFCHTVPPELDTLCARSDVTLLLCTDAAGTSPDVPCGIIRFTPQNYAECLKNPEMS